MKIMQLVLSILIPFLTIFYISYFDNKEREIVIEKEFIDNNEPKKSNLYFPNNINLYKNGKVYNLDKIKDKTFLITFFEPWCKACNKEFPTLNKFGEIYKNRIPILAISSGEDMELLKNWKIKYNYQNITFLIDKTGEFHKYFSVNSIPSSFIVKRSGKINYQLVGYKDWLSKTLINYISKE